RPPRPPAPARSPLVVGQRIAEGLLALPDAGEEIVVRGRRRLAGPQALEQVQGFTPAGKALVTLGEQREHDAVVGGELPCRLQLARGPVEEADVEEVAPEGHPGRRVLWHRGGRPPVAGGRRRVIAAGGREAAGEQVERRR